MKEKQVFYHVTGFEAVKKRDAANQLEISIEGKERHHVGLFFSKARAMSMARYTKKKRNFFSTEVVKTNLDGEFLERWKFKNGMLIENSQ